MENNYQLTKSNNKLSTCAQFKTLLSAVKKTEDALNYPTIAQQIRATDEPDVIVMAYGTIAQGLSAFNVKNPMTPEQIELFVEDFIEDYKHESIADLKICLKNARNGVYGTHYQAIDQLTVMEWFGKYLDEKAMERERLHTRLKNKTIDSVSDQVYPALKDAVENIGKTSKNGIKRK